MIEKDSPEDTATESSSDPVDVRVRTPGEDEETNLLEERGETRGVRNKSGKRLRRERERERTHGKRDRSNHHRRKSSLRRSVGLSSSNAEVVLPIEVLWRRGERERRVFSRGFFETPFLELLRYDSTHFSLPDDKGAEGDEHTEEDGDEGESDGSSRPVVNLSEDLLKTKGKGGESVRRNHSEEDVEKCALTMGIAKKRR